MSRLLSVLIEKLTPPFRLVNKKKKSAPGSAPVIEYKQNIKKHAIIQDNMNPHSPESLEMEVSSAI